MRAALFGRLSTIALLLGDWRVDVNASLLEVRVPFRCYYARPLTSTCLFQTYRTAQRRCDWLQSDATHRLCVCFSPTRVSRGVSDLQRWLRLRLCLASAQT